MKSCRFEYRRLVEEVARNLYSQMSVNGAHPDPTTFTISLPCETGCAAKPLTAEGPHSHLIVLVYVLAIIAIELVLAKVASRCHYLSQSDGSGR